MLTVQSALASTKRRAYLRRLTFRQWCWMDTDQFSKERRRNHRHDGSEVGVGQPLPHQKFDSIEANHRWCWLQANSSAPETYLGFGAPGAALAPCGVRTRAVSRLRAQSISGLHWHPHRHVAAFSPTRQRHFCVPWVTWPLVAAAFSQKQPAAFPML